MTTIEEFEKLGSQLLDSGQIKAASEVYQKQTRAYPTNKFAFSNLGVTLSRLGKFTQAIEAYQQAIKLDSKSDFAYFNLGIAYARQDKYSEAIDQYLKAYAINSHNSQALAHLVNRLPFICDWTRPQLARQLDKITSQELALGKKPGEQPFMSVIRSADPQRNLQIARAYSQAALQQITPFICKKKPGKVITVGYASDGFRDFPTAYTITGLFRCHNRDKFRILAYSFSPDDQSQIRREIASLADEFIDLSPAADQAAAAKIYQDQVDILVDLKSHTSGGRLGIFARRPAPIQVNYLGFPGTSGASFIDYFIGDKIVNPPNENEYFTEEIIRLPHCYRPTENKFKIHKSKFTRSSLGLPEKGFIYSSFNGHYKITPEVFAVWMAALNRVPGSVLWLYVTNAAAIQNLIREAKKHRVNPSKIILAGRLSKADHLARISHADLALDTTPVNGHTTTVDCLWAGVPVITTLGTHFASRVSATVLSAAGLPQLVARDLKHYAKLAIDFGLQPSKLPRVSQKTPLFDTQAYTKRLEAAYLWMMH